jgi:predicted metalloprotease with PDZ domain
MPKPQNHYFHVKMELDGFTEKQLKVKMPIWAPGSYLAREFAKNVNLVKAYDSNGAALDVKKINKNTWVINKGDKKKISVKYEVYAFELSVRTSFLDLTHGFVSGSGIFMYVDGHKDQNGTVEVVPYQTFSKVTTALPKTSEGVQKDQFVYTFEDYDQLVDCPIEIGNQEEFSFDAAGVKHHVAIYGMGNQDKEKLSRDMAKIVNAATEVFGQNPNKEYTFIIHNGGSGGLEHTNSTVLGVNRWAYEGDKYLGFLSLVAHEYFHLWNVKRIRPIELGPFNYDEENYTTQLWVMEGFTSYYDELLLLRSGFFTQEQYLKKLFNTINYVEGTPGTRVQPVAHASFDAWIKAYRPNENSRNTTMSYYSKGTVIAAMLDAMIIKKYKGKKCLDDFLQVLYAKYYEAKDRGFSEEEFKRDLEAFLDQNLDSFYAKYINGTEIPDYNEVFSTVGVTVDYIGKPKADVGMSLSTSGGKTIIKGIRSSSAAENAGLSVNDEIVGCNGLRADEKGLSDYFKSVKTGDRIDILFARDQQLYSTEIIVTEYEKPKFKHKVSADKSNSKLFNYWLRAE